MIEPAPIMNDPRISPFITLNITRMYSEPSTLHFSFGTPLELGVAINDIKNFNHLFENEIVLLRIQIIMFIN